MKMSQVAKYKNIIKYMLHIFNSKSLKLKASQIIFNLKSPNLKASQMYLTKNVIILPFLQILLNKFKCIYKTNLIARLAYVSIKSITHIFPSN